MDDMTRRDAIRAAATGVIAGSVPGAAAGAERGGASRPEERAAGDYLILACDGGGYRGLLSALILERIEKQSPFLDRVNLFAGTSTGGFIAIGLASGMSIAEVVNLYRDNGTTIFGGAKPDPEVEPTSRIGKIWAAIRNREGELKESLGFSPKDLLKSKYKADGLNAVLTRAFGGDTKFSDLKQGRSLLVTTLRLSSDKGWAPLVLHNLGVGVATPETRVVDGPTPDTRLVDAALATTRPPSISRRTRSRASATASTAASSPTVPRASPTHWRSGRSPNRRRESASYRSAPVPRSAASISRTSRSSRPRIMARRPGSRRYLAGSSQTGRRGPPRSP